MKKEMRELVKALEAQGFTVEQTRGKHWLVRNAEGQAVCTMANTPSDGRGWLNAIAALRRAGFTWRGR